MFLTFHLQKKVPPAGKEPRRWKKAPPEKAPPDGENPPPLEKVPQKNPRCTPSYFLYWGMGNFGFPLFFLFFYKPLFRVPPPRFRLLAQDFGFFGFALTKCVIFRIPPPNVAVR